MRISIQRYYCNPEHSEDGESELVNLIQITYGCREESQPIDFHFLANGRLGFLIESECNCSDSGEDSDGEEEEPVEYYPTETGEDLQGYQRIGFRQGGIQ